MQLSPLPSGLPQPDKQTLAHSARVAEFINDRITASHGEITFGEFMQLALYAPGLGYYLAGNRKFGRGGDFVTAPEVSPLFGRVVARQCAHTLTQLTSGCILEIGAGTGGLAEQVLNRLHDMAVLPDRYLILEASPELAERQRARLCSALPDLFERIAWVDTIPADFDGVVLANEVADALPVERFRVADRIEQAFVASANTGFTIRWRPATGALERAVDGLDIEFESGYSSEICLPLKPWVASILQPLRHGLVLLFDYGLSRREYYAADRSGGWLRCHFRHRAHTEPLVLPGVQDITAWVDFTAVAEAASANQAKVSGYVTQAMFLLRGGLQDEVVEAASSNLQTQSELSRQIKLLTLPDEMGEHFKCIGLGKGDLEVPNALTDADRAGTL
ncbi:MAG: SAM-dependent methyltransferase [Pseudomonadota bacterium]